MACVFRELAVAWDRYASRLTLEQAGALWALVRHADAEGVISATREGVVALLGCGYGVDEILHGLEKKGALDASVIAGSVYRIRIRAYSDVWSRRLEKKRAEQRVRRG